MKNKGKKVLVIILILVAIGGPSSVYAYNSYNYNKFYDEGQANLESGKYNEAIESFNAALEYGEKHSEEINIKVSLVKELQVSEDIYEDGLKKFNEKKYLEAIYILEKIKKEDIKRYSLAQQKINECKNLYTNDNLEKAKKESANKKYQEAIKYLDLVIKVDSKNDEALKLKNEYNKAIQKYKEEEEKARRVAEEVKKTETKKAEEDKKNEKSKQYTSGNSSEKESIETKDGVLRIVKEDGSWATYSLFIYNSPTIMEFRAIRLGLVPDCDYRAVVHINGKEQVYKGNTSKEVYNSVWITDGGKNKVIPIDVYLTYKGKEYKFTKKYTLR